MRAWLLALLSLGVTAAQASDFWSSLWLTADQRGEELLQQGDAAAAARTYSDLRRRAYAELRAGDYPAAARDFAAFDDSDAHYNRGNALARAGDLAAALQAYDTALARDPNNRDARHNRELVAKALQQQPPPPKQGGDQGKSGQQGKSGKQGKSGDQGQAQGARGKSSSGQDQRDGKPGDQGRRGAQAGDENPGNAAKAVKAANPGNGQSRQDQPDGNDADQARRDAAAGLGRKEPGRNAKNLGQADAPRSERQLAQEQWLRQIPDDPGGLLRRKFMIEHRMRQQGNQ